MGKYFWGEENDMVNSGALVKKYRSLLKISQKEAAGSRMSHSMVSLIESGKIQLTTVTAMIIADNFNKIASAKGIDLNLSLKDLLSDSSFYIEEGVRKSFQEAVDRKAAENEFITIFNCAKENNSFEVMAEIKLYLGRKCEAEDDFYGAIEHYNKSVEYFKLTEGTRFVMESIISLARCYNRLGDYDISEGYLKLLKNDYLNKQSDEQIAFKVNMELIYLLKQTGKNNDALRMIESLLKNKKISNLSKKELLLAKSDIYLGEKKCVESISILKKVLSTSLSTEYTIIHKLAVAYLIIGSTEEGLSCISQCIKCLNNSPREENTRLLLMFAEELNNFEVGSYSIKYYDYALVNSNLFNQQEYQLICYKSIFELCSKIGDLKSFQSYAQKIEESIYTGKNVENLTHYLILLTRYYLKSSQEKRLQEIMDKFETVV